MWVQSEGLWVWMLFWSSLFQKKTMALIQESNARGCGPTKMGASNHF